jgi:Domain of unknown function (DUF5664)
MATSDLKDTNPKDAIASSKLDMGLVPDTMVANAALAFTEGALKYGRYNWRIAGVRASVYHAALRRHVAKWWNGQDIDPKTGVPHLANALACIAIILDAQEYNRITDDRPPSPDYDEMAVLIDSMEEDIVELKEMFADKNPKQFTILDGSR